MKTETIDFCPLDGHSARGFAKARGIYYMTTLTTQLLNSINKGIILQQERHQRYGQTEPNRVKTFIPEVGKLLLVIPCPLLALNGVAGEMELHDIISSRKIEIDVTLSCVALGSFQISMVKTTQIGEGFLDCHATL